MEETQVQATEPEAPPGDATPAPEAAAPTEQPHVATPPADGGDPGPMPDPTDADAMAAWLVASEAYVNATATAEETPADPAATASSEPAVDAPRSAPAAETERQPPAAPADAFDEATVLQKLMERGYKVEAPPPPPDPYADLTTQLAPLVGTAEQYTQIKARATAPVPPEPDQYAADYDEQLTAYRAAVKDRNEAAAELARLDLGRSVTDVAIPWARQRVLGELGVALEGVPQKYGLDEARAKRVVEPTAMTDAIDAVVEAVTSQWQAKYDARERYWQGEVARAKSDAGAERVQRMGRAPQATVTSGARPAGPGPIWEVDPKTGLPTEASIQRAIRGDYANIDLS